ncbi:ParA family protein [Vibrio metoecus]|uniref:ParA family protein n=1 Tax=Vibrio metoecus TaxID=1481663 RepID=UPI000BA962A4|nr:ParA family protein [Vibrio metoecus]PAR34710.1 cobyrinic acid a,c-diamide synthase [Vibrio metoecus]PAR43673.1 cobyrinic acid a,c-diamide synthase [Vibrio metoecus]
MKSISIFNNKGGVGKSTLTHHLGCALNELGIKTLMIDLDPQSNLSLFSLTEEQIEKIWHDEDSFIDDYETAKSNILEGRFKEIHSQPRSIHYILKPIEDGQSDEICLPPPFKVDNNLDLIPGRLTLHMFENKVAKQWSEAFLGEPQALRTITAIRQLCFKYQQEHNYEVILIDTSPSLGLLNKVIISNSDAFIIPCAPDMFSDYGIKNIGNALNVWKREFSTMYSMLSDLKRTNLRKGFVKLLGYTIYNAKKRSDATNELKIARAHYNWAKKLPNTISNFVPKECFNFLNEEEIKTSIGSNAIIYGHGTLPTMAQKYKLPMWKVPDHTSLDNDDKGTISGNKGEYYSTCDRYKKYASEVLARLEKVVE